MNLKDTLINHAGLFRCCLDTIEALPDGEYQPGQVVDCKHEAPGNRNIILLDGVWCWNNDEAAE